MAETQDTVLQASMIRTTLEPKHLVRAWQGIPGIERASNGRLWAAFYSGGEDEGPGNFVALVTSGDNGLTWSDIQIVVEHDDPQVRAFDPCLWHDPQGRLWLFWAQSRGKFDGRYGVWSAICDDSTLANPRWSQPQRLADGIMMNKPTVLANGEWMLPIADWAYNEAAAHVGRLDQLAHVYVSDDRGVTFHKRGSADVPNRCFDEHMLVERGDGSLWMLVRTFYGIGESVSSDRGVTWSPGVPTTLGGPNSRFFITRLHSGNLLLVNHYGFRGRSHLTAMLSEDDGHTWNRGLLLDERADVSYPDGVQDEQGRIYIVYDRERKKAKEILLAVFTEEDIKQGECVSEHAMLKQVINRG